MEKNGLNKCKRVAPLFLIYCLLSLVVPYMSAGAEDTKESFNVMPIELVEHAKMMGCEQIADFYKDVYDYIEAPYAYGYFIADKEMKAIAEKEKSAVYWCRKKQDSDYKYFLVIYSKVIKPNKYSCPDIIPHINPPAGLSIIQNADLQLSDFVYIQNPSERGPKNIKTSHNVISSYHDGVEEYFYCHEGKWLIRQLH